MPEDNLFRTMLRNLPWLVLIIATGIWLHIDINFNTPFPVENAFAMKGKLLFGSENFAILFDKFSTAFPAYIMSAGTLSGTYTGARAISLIFSIITLFFFYKFSKIILEDKLASLFSLFFFFIQPSFIFISKFASSDIIALTFFTAFLWAFSLLIQKYTQVKQDNLKLIIISSITLMCALACNLLIIIFLPIAIILLFMFNKKSGIYFTGITILLLIIFFIIGGGLVWEQLLSIFKMNPISMKILKLLTRIAEYIALPIMLIFASLQLIWKTNLKKSMIIFFMLVSLLIPFYVIIFQDIYNLYRLIPISLILLSPFCGLVISKFIKIDAAYKYSAIFFFYFITALSYWQVTRLESSYPNTNEIINYCRKNCEETSNIYCEDPFLAHAYFFPKNNSKHYDISEEKNQIIKSFKSYEVDFVILSGLINPEFSEYLKTEFLSIMYFKVLTLEFDCQTLMYTNGSSQFEVYQIKDTYKSMRRLYANK